MFLDHLPSHERERIRRRLRSPEEYERLREKVKGPEDLEKELKRSEGMAELHLKLESEPAFHEQARSRIAEDIRERGVDDVIDGNVEDPAVLSALNQGNFRVAISSHPQTHEDTVSVLPEGNVQEKLPVKPSFNDSYSSALLSHDQG